MAFTISTLTKKNAVALSVLASIYLLWTAISYFSSPQIHTTDQSALNPHKNASLTIGVNTYCGVPPTPDPRLLIQPDGSVFEAYLRLQDHVVYLETLDGFTIMKDPADGFYRYVSRGTEGDLAISGVPVSERGERNLAELSLLQAIPKHLRFKGDKLAELEDNYPLKTDDTDDQISAVFPPAGVQRSILLLIDFPDQLASYTVGEFDNLANQTGYSVNGASGSFREYYEAISYGLLTVNTDVEGWYTAIDNRATYGVQDLSNRNYDGAVNLVREAVDAAEAAGIDFSQYDGDGDGRVDVVEIIHSGRGAEESANAADIWSHRWVLSARGLSVTYDNVLVNDYIIQAEKYGSTNITNIGVLVHEFGHALGLPDLYDTNGGSSGIGRWCCMAGGTWNNSGKTPANFSAWCKEELGWTSPTVLSAEGSVSNIAPSDIDDEVYRLNTPNTSEYFLLENRQQTGWDSYIPGEGLVIYHIDQTRSSNSDETRPKVGIEQADGNGSISSLSNSGDTGDPFPGSSGNDEFSCSSAPNSNNYNGDFTNVSVSNISASGDLISFDYGYCSTDCSMQDIQLNGSTTNLAGGTYDQSFLLTYGFPPASGTLDVTVAGISQNLAITGSPQTVNFTGLPADGESVDVSASFSADSDCSLTINDLYTAPRNCSNDDFCNALDISSYIDGALVSCTNIGATIQTNEPAPNAVSCSVQNGWCENVLTNTVWFKFTAPASGSIDIDFATSIDLQMAVWEVHTDCSDLTDANERLLVAANDDNGSAGGYSPRIENLRCLVPGKEYYLQIDGWSGTTGNFAFEINDPDLSCTVAPITSASCGNTYNGTSDGNGTWVHLEDGSGNRIASVNDQFNNLGALTVSYTLNEGEIRKDTDNYPLLDRDWFINAANNNNATVRLYLKDSELQDFINAGGQSNLDDFSLLKISGGSCGNFNDGTSAILVPNSSKMLFDGSNHMLEFKVTGFSGFFPRSDAAILPIELQYFRGRTKEKTNLLEWASSLEENTKVHEIEQLLPHEEDWRNIGQVAAVGYSQELVAYKWEDYFPLPFAYYRIKTVDLDGSFQYSEIISLERKTTGVLISKAYPNPSHSQLTIELYTLEDADLHYTLLGTDGQIIKQQQQLIGTGLNHLELELSDYPSGIYFLKINIGNQQVIRKLIKE